MEQSPSDVSLWSTYYGKLPVSCLILCILMILIAVNCNNLYLIWKQRCLRNLVRGKSQIKLKQKHANNYKMKKSSSVHQKLSSDQHSWVFCLVLWGFAVVLLFWFGLDLVFNKKTDANSQWEWNGPRKWVVPRWSYLSNCIMAKQRKSTHLITKTTLQISCFLLQITHFASTHFQDFCAYLCFYYLDRNTFY